MVGGERRPPFVVLTFGIWTLVGTLLLGLTIDRLITPWEGADVLRRSHDPLRAFYNWDAVHYINIARNGYANPMERVFYPLFPLLLRGVLALVRDPAVAGLLLTTVLSMLFAVVYHRFAVRLLSETHAGVALIAVIAMPSAFFLHCIYAEPLFLLLLFLFLLLFLEESWGAGVVAIALAITRGQGIFVGFAVALILAFELPSIVRERRWLRAAYLVGTGVCFLLGLLGLMAFHQYAYGNPLEFVTAQTKYFHGISDFSLANSFRPAHVLGLLTTIPTDLNGPQNGLIDQVCMYASIALAPLVWRLNRQLFAFYLCLAYFPATMGSGGSYFRYFLLPYSIAALALARAYVDRKEIFGVGKERVACAAVTLGFMLQAGLSLLHAAHRWVG